MHLQHIFAADEAIIAAVGASSANCVLQAAEAGQGKTNCVLQMTKAGQGKTNCVQQAAKARAEENELQAADNGGAVER